MQQELNIKLQWVVGPEEQLQIFEKKQNIDNKYLGDISSQIIFLAFVWFIIFF